MSKKLMLLKNKVAIITGCDDSIGKATAWAMVEAGAKVIFVSNEENSGVEFVRAVREQGGEAIYQIVNITMSGELDILFDRLNREFGRLDIAFNNTAIECKSEFLTCLESEDVTETIDVNVYGTWLTMRYEIEQMLINQGGVIINNCGVLGINPQPKKSLESATKSAIVSMTQAAALEYANSGIRINAVAIGSNQVNLDSYNYNFNHKQLVAPSISVFSSRRNRPEKIAKAIVWLSSDNAVLATGHVIPLIIN